jgi:hypothetical protein
MLQQTHFVQNNGIGSFAEASPDYELAPVGIGSFQDQARKLAEYGRNGDVYVVHAAEGETVVPMEVLNANPKVKELLFGQMREMGLDPQEFVVGNELNSINPVTGLPEFFFSSIFRAVKKAFKKVVKVVKKIAPIVIPIAASLFGVPFLGPMFGAGTFGAAFLGSGIGTLAGGGSLKDAFKSGLAAGGTSLLFSGIGTLLKGGNLSDTFSSSFLGKTPVRDPGSGALLGHRYAASPYSDALWSSPGAEASALASDAQWDTIIGTGSKSADPWGGLTKQFLETPTKTSPGFVAAPKVVRAPLSSSTVVPASTVVAPSSSSTVVTNTPVTVSRGMEGANMFHFDTSSKGITSKGPFLGRASPSRFVGIPPEYQNPVDAAILGTAALGVTSAVGGLDPVEEPQPEPKDLAGFVPRQTGQDLITKDPKEYMVQHIDPYQYLPDGTPIIPTKFPAVQQAARGGMAEFPRRELLVEGPGTERSDDIPAMLSDGEFVMNARAVRGADPTGRGNRHAGAKNLYNMMRNFEMRS